MTKTTTTSPRNGATPAINANRATGTSSPSTTPRRDDDSLRLAALQSMDVKSELSFTDVRGWRVQSSDRHIIGSVTRMLVEQKPSVMPRYLDILIDPVSIGLQNTEPFNLLVPIGAAMVAKGGTGVTLSAFTTADIPKLPRLGHGPVSWEFELAIARAFGVKEPATTPAALYAHPQYDLAVFQRQQPAGS